ncbi:uncharacterized protein LOC119730196 [Patiria miniata]|uniref:Ig-like domain-containing protein n=1 Tax=Patiria miniata TaxID=46514 RepID=A0A914A5Y1_PATMI|nr:uncharacterized protein LOC119730196 [Patiria miniata]
MTQRATHPCSSRTSLEMWLPKTGSQRGVYDIDNEFNLIIKNVTASNEGTYYFAVKRHSIKVKWGRIEVCDKVSPNRLYPTVIGCNQDHDVDTCEVRVRHDSTVHNLTCVMEQVKPAVQLKWIRLFMGGKTELTNVSTTVRPVVLPAYTGSLLRNKTFSTSASVQVVEAGDEEVYECEAIGIAVGGSTRTRVRLSETHPTTATYDEVQSSKKSGAAPVTADDVSPTAIANKPAEKFVPLIVLSVLLSILLTF